MWKAEEEKVSVISTDKEGFKAREVQHMGNNK